MKAHHLANNLLQSPVQWFILMIQQEMWGRNDPAMVIIVKEQFVEINLLITIGTRYKHRMMNDMWI